MQPPHFHLDQSTLNNNDWHILTTNAEGQAENVLVRKWDSLQVRVPSGEYEPFSYLVTAREASIAVKIVNGSRPDYIIHRERYGVVYQ